MSDGLHNRTDEECQQIAHHVRIVLSNLAKKMKDVLEEDVEVREAVKALTKIKASSSQQDT